MSIFDSLKKTSIDSTSINNNMINKSNTKEFDLNIEKILENWKCTMLLEK